MRIHKSTYSVKTKLIAFNAMVRPILEYATQVWSPHNVGLTKSIDVVQRKAIRWVYRLKKLDSVTDCMKNNNNLLFLTGGLN